MYLQCAEKYLNLSYPQIMGILNVTPDSLYSKVPYHRLDEILSYTEQMIAEGATIIDVGGESTRPGAIPVSLQEELDRVMPVVDVLRRTFPVVISVDTSKPEVMRAAIAAGIHMINDVNALRSEGALEIVATSDVAVCLMHKQSNTDVTQKNPYCDDIIAKVKTFLIKRVEACMAAGIVKKRLVIDPGFGFGKTLQQNLHLLKHLDEFCTLGLPLLVGLSRKGMMAKLLGLPVEQRLYTSLALAVLAVFKGAMIVRVHDVKPTIEAIRVATAVLAEN